MRKGEITSELIELSKHAKELGFPQDVEEGDWFVGQRYHPERLDLILYGYDTYHPDNFHPSWKILSFSRCLEWLRERGYTLESLSCYFPVGDQNSNRVQLFNYMSEGDPMHPPRFVVNYAKTHHEATAKAVVKILEGEG